MGLGYTFHRSDTFTICFLPKVGALEGQPSMTLSSPTILLLDALLLTVFWAWSQGLAPSHLILLGFGVDFCNSPRSYCIRRIL